MDLHLREVIPASAAPEGTAAEKSVAQQRFGVLTTAESMIANYIGPHGNERYDPTAVMNKQVIWPTENVVKPAVPETTQSIKDIVDAPEFIPPTPNEAALPRETMQTEAIASASITPEGDDKAAAEARQAQILADARAMVASAIGSNEAQQ